MSDEAAAVAAFAAAVFSGATLIGNSRFSSRLERDRWLREMRMSSFLSLKREVSILRDRFNSAGVRGPQDFVFSDVNTALSEFEMVSRDDEGVLVARLRGELREFVTATEEEVRRVARQQVDSTMALLLKSTKESLVK